MNSPEAHRARLTLEQIRFAIILQAVGLYAESASASPDFAKSKSPDLQQGRMRGLESKPLASERRETFMRVKRFGADGRQRKRGGNRVCCGDTDATRH